MRLKWIVLPSFIAGLLLFSAAGWSEEKSIGVRVGYNFAQSACEDHETSCDNQSVSGGVYFRHHLYAPYFYQLSVDYLGQYKATYPALENSNAKAHYKADVTGLGLSVGRLFSFTDKHALIGQVGVMTWYVKTSGKEVTYSVSESEYGVSPFASLEYQYTLSQSTDLGLGYQYVYGVGSDDSTGGTDLHQLFLGVSYRFGQ